MRDWCKHTVRLDTYHCGCMHNCSYCYAKSLLNFRKFWNSDLPKVTAIQKIVLSIKSHDRNNVIRLGGMTDCFQFIEQKERITYNTILWLNRYKIQYLIVTKSDLVSSDEYMKIYDKSLVHFQISISATEQRKCSNYEKAPSIKRRIAAIEKLYNEGFDVSVRLSPFIFQFTDCNIINSIGCNKILIEFLKVNHWIKKWFKIDYSDYSLKYGGYEHLQLSQKIELVNKITGFEQVSVGEYVDDHYNYFRENVNYNKSDCCNLSLPNRTQCEQMTLPI